MTARAKPSAWPPWPRVWCGGPAEPHGPPMLDLTLDVVTKSEANVRGFWQATKRKKAQDAALDAALEEALVGVPLRESGPWCVRFTRLSSTGHRLDDDNLAGAFKRLRDRLCRAIMVDDLSPSIAFAYAQQKHTAAGVRVEVWGGGCATDPVALRAGGG